MAFALMTACSEAVPSAGTAEHRSAFRAFYVGLSAMQVGDDQRARTELNELVKLVPGEPAAWGNLGVLQLRQKDLPAAAASFEKAAEIVPDNVQLLRNRYVLEAQRGDYQTATAYLERAIALDPNDLKARFALAKEHERQTNDSDAYDAYRAILTIKPDNLPSQIEAARLAAKRGEADNVKTILVNIAPRTTTWDAEIRKQFEILDQAAASGDLRSVSQNLAFFRNTLLRLPEFRAAIAEVRFDDATVGEVFMQPLKLPVPDFSPAEPDTELAFTSENVANEAARWCRTLFLDGDSPPVVVWANGSTVHIADRALPVGEANEVQAIDLDHNFKNDLVVVGGKGLQFFDDKFQDVTAKSQLPSSILGQKYSGAFLFDIEADGDLDLILASESSPPTVLQNSSNGVFNVVMLFESAGPLTDFAAGDLDEDGDADVALLDTSGSVHFFSNERGGRFTRRELPAASNVNGLAIGDLDGNGRLDLNLLGSDGSVTSLTDVHDGQTWSTRQTLAPGSANGSAIYLEDLDNNGSLDLLLDRIWLSGSHGHFASIDARLSDARPGGDLNGDGRVDLVALTTEGNPARLINSGTKNYGWQILRPRAATTDGDQRINSFGVGSEIEVRSGLLAQKRVSSSPQVHFGLGNQSNVDVMRVVWGNGYVQAEFDMKPSETVLIEQRLKGSCPHLFTWNGTEFKMVKDAPPWSPALGLKINAQDTFGILETEEWFKIPGENLAAKDGFYELRITGEYWETFYLDHYALLAVDHPEDREVHTDERFAIPPVELKVTTTAMARPFLSALGNDGKDVSDVVKAVDERYLDDFERGPFQGIAASHFVELTLPDDAMTDQKLWLIGEGWVHPTDASINVQWGQSSHPAPEGLSIEIPDGNGGWKTAKEDLGFPAGKMKTVLLELPKGERRFRLGTNMEIFWDRLSWAADVTTSETIETRLSLASAELRHRGFSVMNKRDASSPEIPDYSNLQTTTQKWRDLEGYYTRYGDVLELLTGIDDRYIISGAGDELVLKFPELPPVRKGWRRDFVIIGDGWIKDGDLNSVFSKTVLPLPTHSTNDYSRRPSLLEDDPVYKRHSTDWQVFHTRYVAP
ncbi:MAG: FG-GAP-like repeat-containing protein, partial [Pyrinomonadaceae bacterium]